MLMLVRSTSSFEPNVEFVCPLGRRLRFKNDCVLRHYLNMLRGIRLTLNQLN